MPAAFLGIRSLETIVSVHEDDTDTYCGTNCNCPDTWCFSLPLGDFSTFDFSSVTPGLQEAGSYDGNNWNATDIQLTGGFTNRAVGIEYNLGQTVSAETYEWQGLAQQGFGTLGSGLYVARIQLFNGATNVFDSGTGADPNFSDTSHIWSSSETFDRIRFWQVVSRATGGQVGGAGSTSALILRGNGVNPFGSDNC